MLSAETRVKTRVFLDINHRFLYDMDGNESDQKAMNREHRTTHISLDPAKRG